MRDAEHATAPGFATTSGACERPPGLTPGTALTSLQAALLASAIAVDLHDGSTQIVSETQTRTAQLLSILTVLRTIWYTGNGGKSEFLSARSTELGWWSDQGCSGNGNGRRRRVRAPFPIGKAARRP